MSGAVLLENRRHGGARHSGSQLGVDAMRTLCGGGARVRLPAAPPHELGIDVCTEDHEQHEKRRREQEHDGKDRTPAHARGADAHRRACRLRAREPARASSSWGGSSDCDLAVHASRQTGCCSISSRNASARFGSPGVFDPRRFMAKP
ncbi:MAG TPA: hypothetical protein VFB22_04755 [Candidatus Baltobacteraceae bacterium]|nr:hypothetical protein [Candidatus Baltobacteraceae bacterium]